MSVFVYQVKNKEGKILTGQLEGATERDVANKLREDGYYITSIRPKKAADAKSGIFGGFGKKVKLNEMLIFSKQLSVLIRAGLSINSCLRILSEQTENPFFASEIKKIRSEVEGGEAFFEVLKRRPKIFSSMYTYMIEAGEASGQLDTVLDRLVEHLEREFELKKKVTGAMIYPMVIAGVATIAVFVLMIVVVPTFTQMFADGGMELPLITKLLIEVSKIFAQYWYLIAGALLGTIGGVKFYASTAEGKKTMDKLFFGLPVVGLVIQKVVAARFTRTLATLLDSGVLITNAMEIVERAVGNSVAAAAINRARVSVTKGTGMAAPLAETKIMPQMVTQMIAVGEETGELSTMLNNVADFYEKEAGYAIEGLTTMIEPVIIICMGLGVGVVVAGIAFPMMDISSGAGM